MQINLDFPDNGHVPPFLQTVTALGSIPAIFWRAMEFGASQNRSFFELLSHNEIPRPHIREMIVRDQAKRYLERLNFQVDDDDVTVGNEPLVAVAARFGPVQFRILKGKDGILPGCGESSARRRFYSQNPKFYMDAQRRTQNTKLNLIVLWDFDAVFNVAGLWLVCPKSGGARAEDVRWFWHEPLAHPLVTAEPEQASAQTTEDEVDRDLERLLRDEKSEEQEENESKVNA